MAGYDAADNIHYHNVTGSLTSAIANIDFRTNVGILGKFAFHVDNNVDSECYIRNIVTVCVVSCCMSCTI